VYLQCKTVQAGRAKIAEDKERRGYRKRQKRKRRKIHFLSLFCQWCHFKWTLLVEVVGRIKGTVKSIQSFAFSNVTVDIGGGW